MNLLDERMEMVLTEQEVTTERPVINEKDHLGLIHAVALDLVANDEFCRRRLGTDVGEYLTYGYFGLRSAIKNYRPEKGAWGNYAWKVIRDTIIKHARRTTLVRVADGARYQAWRKLQGREKSNPRLSDSCINAAAGWLEREIVPMNGQPHETQVGTVDPIPPWENEEYVRHALRFLNKRKRFIIRHRFGIGDASFLTLEELGMVLGITRERVRQLEFEALRELRHRLA